MGYYESELSGAILEGRWSESCVGGGLGQLGDEVHAAGWNGVLTLTDHGLRWNSADIGDHCTVTVTYYTHATQVHFSGGVPTAQ